LGKKTEEVPGMSKMLMVGDFEKENNCDKIGVVCQF
jgi:hypothetical protein